MLWNKLKHSSYVNNPLIPEQLYYVVSTSFSSSKQAWFVLAKLFPGGVWREFSVSISDDSQESDLEFVQPVSLSSPPMPQLVTPKVPPSPQTKTVKVKVDGNETSPNCLKCGGANKEVQLFIRKSFYCPKCE